MPPKAEGTVQVEDRLSSIGGGRIKATVRNLVWRECTGILSTAALLVPLVFTSGADAQERYREGQPPVLEKRNEHTPVADDVNQEIEAFEAAYSAKGRPRVMLFWNRSISDQLEVKILKEKTRRKEGVKNKSSESQKDDSGGEVGVTDARYSEVEVEKTNETVVDAGRREGPAEAFTWALEDAVLRALTVLKVNVVDRSAAMRFSSSERDPARSTDAIRTETQAMLDRADVMLEILSTKDASAPSGLLYRILVKEVHTARVLATRVTDARPPPMKTSGTPRSSIRIGRNGLERAVAEEPSATVAQVARELTRQVLATLAIGIENLN